MRKGIAMIMMVCFCMGIFPVGAVFAAEEEHTVTVSSLSQAKVELEKETAVKGEPVVFTVSLKEGQKVADVVVRGQDGKQPLVMRQSEDSYGFTMPDCNVNIKVFTEKKEHKTEIWMQVGNAEIKVNGELIQNDVAPILHEGNTMVPVRVITETLGGQAEWNPQTHGVRLSIENKVIVMNIGVEIPGLKIAPIIQGQRTYVPLRYIAESLGADVEWMAATQQILVSK